MALNQLAFPPDPGGPPLLGLGQPVATGTCGCGCGCGGGSGGSGGGCGCGCGGGSSGSGPYTKLGAMAGNPSPAIVTNGCGAGGCGSMPAYGANGTGAALENFAATTQMMRRLAPSLGPNVAHD